MITFTVPDCVAFVFFAENVVPVFTDDSIMVSILLEDISVADTDSKTPSTPAEEETSEF